MKNNFKAFFLFSVISGILIFSWFRYGHLYGGGDVGLQTYNPQRILENARFVWWESTAPGSPFPQALSAIPFQFILFLLQSIGFSPVMLQAALFFILLFLMGFGMYLFLKQKLEGQFSVFPILGGLFYMLNPYMMIAVWHRFIHTTIMLAAVLPFFAISWGGWIKNGKAKHLGFFLLTSFLAVYLFGTFAYIVTAWIFLLFVALSNLIPWGGRKLFLKIAGRFLFGFIVWILINCWWLLPVFKISPAQLSEQHRISDSLTTLIMISEQAILPFTLQLVNPFYLFGQAEFGTIYKNFVFQLIPFVFVAIILIGLISALKDKRFSLFAIFFLIAIFLTKGAAPPFGNLYIFGFKNFFPLGVLRNPFEKTGLILVFLASILFTFGLKVIFDFFKVKINVSVGKIALFIPIVLLLIFSWPMLLGKLIGRIDKPAYVEVPNSYTLADDWLKQQKNTGISDGKILHLPLTRGESVQYKWEYGYNGLEPSDTFFTSYPSISRGFNMSRVDDALTGLSLSFKSPFSEQPDKILSLLQAFSIRFIVLHRDINWQGTDLYSPLEAEKVLNNLKFLQKKAEYGDLAIYQLADEFFRPKIEIKSGVSLIYPQSASMKVWPWLISKDGSFVSPVKDQDIDAALISYTNGSLIFPQGSFSYPEASASSLEATKKDLISKLNGMVAAASYVKQLGIIQTDTEKTVQEIISFSAKLVEIYQNISAAADYLNLLKNILPKLAEGSTLYFDIDKSTINDILKLHEVFLSAMLKRIDGSQKAVLVNSQDEIREFLKKEKSLPEFEAADQITELGQRKYYRFWINSPGIYELLLTNSKIKDVYLDKLERIDFQINDTQKTLSGTLKGDLVSLGMIDLRQGLNEISLTNPASVNLLPSFEQLTKMGDVKQIGDNIQMTATPASLALIEGSLGKTAGEDLYYLSFEAQIPSSVNFYIQLIQDSDVEENNQKKPRISMQMPPSQAAVGWQSYNLKLPALSIVTRSANLRIAVVASSDQGGVAVSPALIRNLKIIRILSNDIFLKNSRSSEEASSSAQILNFRKVNPVQYEGEMNLEKAGFVFFKETYHPGWKISLISGDQTISPPDHFIGDLYGNAWYIEKAGRFKFKIYFEPQRNFYFGLLLSGVGIIALCAYEVLRRRMVRNEK